MNTNKGNLTVLRNTCKYLLAYAVNELFDDIKLGTSATTEKGIYYDFGYVKGFNENDLKKIEKKLKEIINKNLDIITKKVSVDEAKKIFINQPYKLEIIDELSNKKPIITICELGQFCDLQLEDCLFRNTNEIPLESIKIQGCSGAYWKGDSKNDMLQRVEVLVFDTKEALLKYEEFIDEAQKRDHRNIGQQMDLFSLNPEIGLGLACFHPKGGMIRYLMQSFSQKAHILNDYKWVYTPHIGRSKLWETSGHLKFYKDSMYNPIEVDGEEYYLKPMSCPFHVEIYNDSQKSYRDLPIRYAEYAAVYRYELSGALQGLTRVRGFTQDDAHIICTKDQIFNEVIRALRFSMYILKSFGLEDFTAYIATKPEKKFIGEDYKWNEAIDSLKEAVIECGLPHKMDEGGGAFYGPKIDLKLKDSLGREWQCSTIQFDFNLPERFNMTYIGEDGEKHTPYMVHRALFGSIERFFAMLVEHYAGDFPLWLAPTQVTVIPINNKRHIEYAKKVIRFLKKNEIRVELDDSGDKLGAKIRRSTIEKVPVMFIIGESEMESNTVSVRSKANGDEGIMSVESWLNSIKPLLDMGKPRYIEEEI